MKTVFTKLNSDWNAEPNSPIPRIALWEQDLLLSFYMNGFAYEEYSEGDIGIIRFRDCGRYRFGRTNDEGWYKGQCRFSKVAPEWGNFYQISGNTKLDDSPNDWHIVSEHADASLHYLFYFQDETFECEAASWSLTVIQK